MNPERPAHDDCTKYGEPTALLGQQAGEAGSAVRTERLFRHVSGTITYPPTRDITLRARTAARAFSRENDRAVRRYDGR